MGSSTFNIVKNIILCENVFFMFQVKSKWCVLLFGCAQSCASGHLDFSFSCLPPPPFSSLLLTTCNCFTDLSVVPSPHVLKCTSHYFTTQHKIDVLGSSSMGWKWPQTGLITVVLHCFQAANSVFVEFFMTNDTFFDFAVHFPAHHQSHLSLRPYSSPAFTNVQLLEKFKETIQLLATVVKTMKTPQSKVSAQIRTTAVKMQTELI